jgi:hypothetical protein
VIHTSRLTPLDSHLSTHTSVQTSRPRASSPSPWQYNGQDYDFEVQPTGSVDDIVFVSELDSKASTSTSDHFVLVVGGQFYDEYNVTYQSSEYVLDEFTGEGALAEVVVNQQYTPRWSSIFRPPTDNVCASALPACWKWRQPSMRAPSHGPRQPTLRHGAPLRRPGRSPSRLGASSGASKPALTRPLHDGSCAFNKLLSTLTNLTLLTPPSPSAFNQLRCSPTRSSRRTASARPRRAVTRSIRPSATRETTGRRSWVVSR